jgi:hypothetical protein
LSRPVVHPLTTAPIWERGKPESWDLPPSTNKLVEPNARHPITGALLRFRAGQKIPDGWEI